MWRYALNLMLTEACSKLLERSSTSPSAWSSYEERYRASMLCSTMKSLKCHLTSGSVRPLTEEPLCYIVGLIDMATS